jgi:hypothetical protein
MANEGILAGDCNPCNTASLNIVQIHRIRGESVIRRRPGVLRQLLCH